MAADLGHSIAIRWVPILLTDTLRPSAAKEIESKRLSSLNLEFLEFGRLKYDNISLVRFCKTTLLSGPLLQSIISDSTPIRRTISRPTRDEPVVVKVVVNVCLQISVETIRVKNKKKNPQIVGPRPPMCWKLF